ncbi:type II 3-dehydroquinate dehydratase [Edaphocola flava]|jgi:3-dehydroquinate dehydratase-2|uniref:type II 3-dehydroquinate dehydratase n=1 Tax=Edaphocola flava TaxID=2499629 RepID=UPI00100B2289|nr:type II 3-dehydroquinate dehydratase [Edaphocola flava]
MKIKIINGPNLNMLGTRQPHIYGNVRFEDYLLQLEADFKPVVLSYFQSNHEGALIDEIQSLTEGGYDALILNPAAYGHTSIAIADALACLSIPIIEVHISDISKRESFRHHTYTAVHALHMITGKGLDGYKEAINLLLNK